MHKLAVATPHAPLVIERSYGRLSGCHASPLRLRG